MKKYFRNIQDGHFAFSFYWKCKKYKPTVVINPFAEYCTFTCLRTWPQEVARNSIWTAHLCLLPNQTSCDEQQPSQTNDQGLRNTEDTFVDTEQHFLVTCKTFKNTRNYLYAKMDILLPGFKQLLLTINRFINLMFDKQGEVRLRSDFNGNIMFFFCRLFDQELAKVGRS